MTVYEFCGKHVIADVYDIPEAAVHDEELILQCIPRAIVRAGATVCGMQTKHFQPSGLTAVYLLAESHVSIHTYPEQRALFFDAFTCGNICQPEIVLYELIAQLEPCKHQMRVMRRGTAADYADLVPSMREAEWAAEGSAALLT